MTAKTGILLVNLGTPAAPTPESVGPYLKQFLMDPLVISVPRWLRWILVHLLIVPRRKVASAALYRNIWTEKGSPLLVYSRRLTDALQTHLGKDFYVTLGMRYGAPSLANAFSELRGAGVDRIVVVPLYPHYALSSVETCLRELHQLQVRVNDSTPIRFTPEFFDYPPYIANVAATIKEVPQLPSYDHLLFSFHGLPDSHIHLTDPGEHCLRAADCCEHFATKAPHCYRAQCIATAKAVIKELKWPEDRQSFAFQSRLSRAWIKPFTDEVIHELRAKGVKRLLVACPAFTADCLETLEEISFRLRDEFLKIGGEELTLVPSLNDRPDWTATIARMIQERPTTPLDKRPMFPKPLRQV